ncbi:MAG: SDR family NAD(P)-dependent oxidoreductase [Tepidisphaerales bacterium]
MNSSSPPSRPTALITGASAGIGLDLARLFAAGGHNLILVARRKEVLEQTATECSARHQVRAEVIAADLADPAESARILDETTRRGLSVDILVNNAGFGSHGEFAAADIARELAMVQVNVCSLIHLTRLFLPAMLERKSGRILNVASMAGFVPGPYMSTYYATKSFVVSHSLALWRELRRTGVSLTILCPGPTHTEFQQSAGIGHAKLFSGSSVMRSIDVARAGYEGCLKGKLFVVPGAFARLSLAAARLVPLRLLTRFVADRNRKR